MRLANVSLKIFIEDIEKAVQTQLLIFTDRSSIVSLLGIECPAHQECYLNVATLRTKGKDMRKKRHRHTDDVLKKPPVRPDHGITVQQISQQRFVQICQVRKYLDRK